MGEKDPYHRRPVRLDDVVQLNLAFLSPAEQIDHLVA
jgi:hypothetical protein